MYWVVHVKWWGSFSADTLLPSLPGTTDFNMTKMPQAAETASSCSLDQLSGDEEPINLFKKKRIEGWWPVYQQEEGGEKDLKVN